MVFHGALCADFARVHAVAHDHGELGTCLVLVGHRCNASSSFVFHWRGAFPALKRFRIGYLHGV